MGKRKSPDVWDSLLKKASFWKMDTYTRKPLAVLKSSPPLKMAANALWVSVEPNS